MIDALRVAMSVAVPWLAGYGCLRAVRGPAASNAFVDWGYAHFVGLLIVTLLMRLAGAAGVPLHLGLLLSAQLAIAAVGCAVAWRRRPSAVVAAPPATNAGEVDAASRGLVLVVLLLLAWRFAALAVDVTLRPLFPWDAWTQWATKARVWSELHELVPFIAWEDWLAGARGYTDVAPHYPTTIPLLQAWTSLALGRYDDALMNVPWLAGAVALALAIYGQLRRLHVDTRWALVVTYAVLSLPIVDTHVALAGYADFHVAAAFALALMALMAWEVTGDRFELLLLVLIACLLPLLKVPGLAWAAIVALGALVVRFGATWRRVLGLGVVTALAGFALAYLVWRNKISAAGREVSAEVLSSLADHLFLFDNWHLLWYLFPIVVAVAWRDALARLRGASAALAAGGVFLIVIFTGTRVSNWVTDYTTVNRAVLHVAPAAAVFAGLLLWFWAQRRDADATAPSAAPAVAQQAVEVLDGAGEPVA